ncbi:MAG: aminoacyl-tRNA hydrolase [Verrucomicrobiota bacterium]|nr:aminoacyl-tRNA hydrolase [Verrucomicrobiota bacterium]
MKAALLIVGLGNPGSEYEGTRHNFGSLVVTRLAEKHGLSFQSKRKWRGRGAVGEIESEQVLLLQPATFMNESGLSVAAALREEELTPSELLVVVDDVELPLGKLRMRTEGASGGHNGLKSVEAYLGTREYVRLRLGVGRGGEDLAEYVLGRFSSEEQKALPEVVEKAVRAIEIWIEQGNNSAMRFVNASNPSTGVKDGA